MKLATQLHRGSVASNDNWYKRPLTFGHHSGLAHPRQDAVQFANFHSCDDSLDRRDELVLLANCDCSFTPLKLDGLCAIVDGENDSSRRISAPPTVPRRHWITAGAVNVPGTDDCRNAYRPVGGVLLDGRFPPPGSPVKPEP